MIAGLITGLILGGALAWFFMNLRMKAFARECNERMEGLKVSAGKLPPPLPGFAMRWKSSGSISRRGRT